MHVYSRRYIQLYAQKPQTNKYLIYTCVLYSKSLVRPSLTQHQQFIENVSTFQLFYFKIGFCIPMLWTEFRHWTKTPDQHHQYTNNVSPSSLSETIYGRCLRIIFHFLRLLINRRGVSIQKHDINTSVYSRVLLHTNAGWYKEQFANSWPSCEMYRENVLDVVRVFFNLNDYIFNIHINNFLDSKRKH